MCLALRQILEALDKRRYYGVQLRLLQRVLRSADELMMTRYIASRLGAKILPRFASARLSNRHPELDHWADTGNGSPISKLWCAEAAQAYAPIRSRLHHQDSANDGTLPRLSTCTTPTGPKSRPRIPDTHIPSLDSRVRWYVGPHA